MKQFYATESYSKKFFLLA